MEELRRLISILLDTGKPAMTLRPEVLEMTEILSRSQGMPVADPEEDIASGETRTESGLAISPTMAMMCADDYVRTIQFLRGTHDAIVERRGCVRDRPVRVLYVGCGPYATLAVPLLSVLSADEARFTLLDLHPESIASARRIVAAFGFDESIASFEVMDAASYCVCAEAPPDVILMEIMQACLEAEPQVAISRHLLAQAPAAILVPEEVRVDLRLIDPSVEFDLGYGDAVKRERVQVGTAFVLNRESVLSWHEADGERLPGGEVTIPRSFEARHQPMLFTEIRVHGEHVLGEYASGLTLPRALAVEGAIRPGSRVRFHYELGNAPGLRAEISD